MNFNIELRQSAHSAFLLSRLKALSCQDGFSDTLLVCRDGATTKSKLAVSLLFPVLAREPIFGLPVTNCVILPDLSLAEVEHMFTSIFYVPVEASESQVDGRQTSAATITTTTSTIQDEIDLKVDGIPSELDEMWSNDGGEEEEDEERVEGAASDKVESIFLVVEPAPRANTADTGGTAAVGEKSARSSSSKKAMAAAARKERQSYAGPVYPGDYPYKCAYCDKRFKQVGHVHQHERTHTGTQKYECGHCRKRFNQLSHIREHERIHTGEKPFECGDCGKRFSFSSGLKSHRKIHDPAERVFECRYCLKRFNQMANMKTHERLHTGDLKFMCAECGRCFNTKSNLARHQCRAQPTSLLPAEKLENGDGDNISSSNPATELTDGSSLLADGLAERNSKSGGGLLTAPLLEVPYS